MLNYPVSEELSIRKSIQSHITDNAVVRTAVNASDDLNRKVKRSLFKSKKRFVKYSLLLSNLLILGLVAVFIMSNRNTHLQSNTPILSLTEEKIATSPLDEISGADIAVNVAQLVHMDQTTSVINHADRINSQLDVVPNDSQVIAKPQLVDTALKSKKDIVVYTTQNGDTVSSLATTFGVSADSIRWSNGLTGETIAVGKEVRIPPINAMVYQVQQGDTPENLATKYRSDSARIIAYNDAEIGGLVAGDYILIPDGQPPAPVVRSYVGGFAFGSAAVYGYNGYDYGWCTWWAAKRRADVGKPIPANFGDACNWVRAAQRAGIPTGTTPSGAGDVIFTNSGCLGHVGFVEELNEDGSIWVTDMNSHGQVSKDDPTRAGGWNRVSWRLVTPDQFSKFKFIY